MGVIRVRRICLCRGRTDFLPGRDGPWRYRFGAGNRVARRALGVYGPTAGDGVTTCPIARDIWVAGGDGGLCLDAVVPVMVLHACRRIIDLARRTFFLIHENQYCGQNLGRLFGNNTIVAKGFVLRAGFFQTQPVS